MQLIRHIALALAGVFLAIPAVSATADTDDRNLHEIARFEKHFMEEDPSTA